MDFFDVLVIGGGPIGHVTKLIAGAAGVLQLDADAMLIGTSVHRYPTLSEEVIEAAHALCGYAIHV